MLSKHSQEMMLQEPMEFCENSGSISGGPLMVAYNHTMYFFHSTSSLFFHSPSKLFSLNHKVIMVMTFLWTKSSPPNLPEVVRNVRNVFPPTPRCEAHQHGTKTSVQRLEVGDQPQWSGDFFSRSQRLQSPGLFVTSWKYMKASLETTKQKKLSYISKETCQVVLAQHSGRILKLHGWYEAR